MYTRKQELHVHVIPYSGKILREKLRKFCGFVALGESLGRGIFLSSKSKSTKVFSAKIVFLVKVSCYTVYTHAHCNVENENITQVFCCCFKKHFMRHFGSKAFVSYIYDTQLVQYSDNLALEPKHSMNCCLYIMSNAQKQNLIPEKKPGLDFIQSQPRHRDALQPIPGLISELLCTHARSDLPEKGRPNCYAKRQTLQMTHFGQHKASPTALG